MIDTSILKSIIKQSQGMNSSLRLEAETKEELIEKPTMLVCPPRLIQLTFLNSSGQSAQA